MKRRTPYRTETGWGGRRKPALPTAFYYGPSIQLK
jgi:hypothetical protein